MGPDELVEDCGRAAAWALARTDDRATVETALALRHGDGSRPLDPAGVPWQGQGYAAEAARALVGWLARRDVREVAAHIHPDHAASARVATRAGLLPTPDRVDGEEVWRLPGRR